MRRESWIPLERKTCDVPLNLQSETVPLCAGPATEKKTSCWHSIEKKNYLKCESPFICTCDVITWQDLCQSLAQELQRLCKYIDPLFLLEVDFSMSFQKDGTVVRRFFINLSWVTVVGEKEIVHWLYIKQDPSHLFIWHSWLNLRTKKKNPWRNKIVNSLYLLVYPFNLNSISSCLVKIFSLLIYNLCQYFCLIIGIPFVL